jgi:N-acetylmuramoyl-L-alanine amidase
MDRLGFLRNRIFGKITAVKVICFVAFISIGFGINCRVEKFQYDGDIALDRYNWLNGKKVFIDPGHGGKGNSDLFRIGPDGIREEEINLRVSLILFDMLKRGGVVVKMSRSGDEDISLRERVDMVNEFKPDLLISIHHNGSPRRVDDVNYPAVLIWGSTYNRPLSYDFARLLLDEFQRMMDERGRVISDFSVYPETGTMVLRETRYTCPGVIGEAGFFSDEMHARRLKDVHYNQLEAEAYFLAIAEFFKRGMPDARIYFSCLVNNKGFLKNMISEDDPIIAIEVKSGMDGIGVNKKTLRVTLDGLPLRYKFIDDSLCIVDYGRRLYPGGHSIRFSFRNSRNQHSMIYHAGFTVTIKRGDYDRLVKGGSLLLKKRRTRTEGLKMLLAALSMGLTDPGADRLLWNIARGFSLIGDQKSSCYYFARLYHFYPESRFSSKIQRSIRDYGIPVEYLGKMLEINYKPSVEGYKQK